MLTLSIRACQILSTLAAMTKKRLRKLDTGFQTTKFLSISRSTINLPYNKISHIPLDSYYHFTSSSGILGVCLGSSTG